MNKTEFIRKVKENLNCNVSAKDSESIVNAVFDTIAGTLAAGDSVKISGFGNFEVRERAARVGVDPRDPSKKIEIKATKTPSFKAGNNLKNAVRGVINK